MTAPIEPVQFVHGPNVVDIGDLRVARGRSRRAPSICRHLNLVFDTAERRIYCLDCQSDVEAFDAFMQMVDRHHHLEEKAARVQSDAAHVVVARAAKVLDQAWRNRSTVPACPHCKTAILAEDVADGLLVLPKALELRRRAKRTTQPDPLFSSQTNR
jgi:hypothetical protein